MSGVAATRTVQQREVRSGETKVAESRRGPPIVRDVLERKVLTYPNVIHAVVGRPFPPAPSLFREDSHHTAACLSFSAPLGQGGGVQKAESKALANASSSCVRNVGESPTMLLSPEVSNWTTEMLRHALGHPVVGIRVAALQQLISNVSVGSSLTGRIVEEKDRCVGQCDSSSRGPRINGARWKHIIATGRGEGGGWRCAVAANISAAHATAPLAMDLLLQAFVDPSAVARKILNCVTPESAEVQGSWYRCSHGHDSAASADLTIDEVELGSIVENVLEHASFDTKCIPVIAGMVPSCEVLLRAMQHPGVVAAAELARQRMEDGAATAFELAGVLSLLCMIWDVRHHFPHEDKLIHVVVALLRGVWYPLKGPGYDRRDGWAVLKEASWVAIGLCVSHAACPAEIRENVFEVFSAEAPYAEGKKFLWATVMHRGFCGRVVESVETSTVINAIHRVGEAVGTVSAASDTCFLLALLSSADGTRCVRRVIGQSGGHFFVLAEKAIALWMWKHTFGLWDWRLAVMAQSYLGLWEKMDQRILEGFSERAGYANASEYVTLLSCCESGLDHVVSTVLENGYLTQWLTSAELIALVLQFCNVVARNNKNTSCFRSVELAATLTLDGICAASFVAPNGNPTIRLRLATELARFSGFPPDGLIAVLEKARGFGLWGLPPHLLYHQAKSVDDVKTARGVWARWVIRVLSLHQKMKHRIPIDVLIIDHCSDVLLYAAQSGEPMISESDSRLVEALSMALMTSPRLHDPRAGDAFPQLLTLSCGSCQALSSIALGTAAVVVAALSSCQPSSATALCRGLLVSGGVWQYLSPFHREIASQAVNVEKWSSQDAIELLDVCHGHVHCAETKLLIEKFLNRQWSSPFEQEEVSSTIASLQ